MGHDTIALKSGWDEYGISYGRPTTNVHIRSVHLDSSIDSSLAFGSEMSGGISDVQVEHVHLHNSLSCIEFRKTIGTGGYIKEIIVTDVVLLNVNTVFGAMGDYGSHPDEKYNPDAFPTPKKITLQDIVGKNITMARNFTGIKQLPFNSICLSNVSLSTNPSSSTSWVCSDVFGYSELVFPEPCPDLNTSSSCFSILMKPNNGRAAIS